MSKNVKFFFLILIVNFLVLGILNVVFEYLDSGDDPLYSGEVAVKNLVVALCVAGAVVFFNKKKKCDSDQDGS